MAATSRPATTVLDIHADAMVEVTKYLAPHEVVALASTTKQLQWLVSDSLVWRTQCAKTMPLLPPQAGSDGWAAVFRKHAIVLPTLLCEFNKSLTADGFALLRSTGLFGAEPEPEPGTLAEPSAAMLDFLFSTPGVSRRWIGRIVSHRGWDNARAVYAARINLAGLGVADGLRAFVAPLSLPGEAQAIDRVVAAFSDAWARDNPAKIAASPADCVTDADGFTDLATRDSIHVLAFATIMLSTDMHSTHRVSGFSAQSFVANCAGLNIPRALVEDVYATLAAAPLTHDSDDVTAPPLIAGNVEVHTSAFLFPWKTRYVRLTHQKLLIFADDNSLDTTLARFPHQAFTLRRPTPTELVLVAVNHRPVREPQPPLHGWAVSSSLFSSRRNLLQRYSRPDLRLRFASPDDADRWALWLNRGLNTAYLDPLITQPIVAAVPDRGGAAAS